MQKKYLAFDLKDTILSQDELSFVGVIPFFSDIVFLSRINRFSKYNFQRKNSICVWKKNKQKEELFDAYFFDYKKKLCRIIIISTYNENDEVFIKNWKDYNHIIIVEGEENKVVAEEFRNYLIQEKLVSIADFLSLEPSEEKTTTVMQMDMFAESNATTIKAHKKNNLGKETIDNLLFSIDDYLSKL